MSTVLGKATLIKNLVSPDGKTIHQKGAVTDIIQKTEQMWVVAFPGVAQQTTYISFDDKSFKEFFSYFTYRNTQQ